MHHHGQHHGRRAVLRLQRSKLFFTNVPQAKKGFRPCLQESVFRRRLNICNIDFHRYPLIKSAPLLYLHLLGIRGSRFLSNPAYNTCPQTRNPPICSRAHASIDLPPTKPFSTSWNPFMSSIKIPMLCIPHETTASPRAATFRPRHFRAF